MVLSFYLSVADLDQTLCLSTGQCLSTDHLGVHPVLCHNSEVDFAKLHFDSLPHEYGLNVLCWSSSHTAVDLCEYENGANISHIILI